MYFKYLFQESVLYLMSHIYELKIKKSPNLFSSIFEARLHVAKNDLKKCAGLFIVITGIRFNIQLSRYFLKLSN